MLSSSFELRNRTILTPFLMFYLELPLVCAEIVGFVEYTPVKCFNDYVQSAVNSRRTTHENLKSNVVNETMNFSANFSYGNQFTVDEKMHAAINNQGGLDVLIINSMK